MEDTIGEILDEKGHIVHSIEPTATIADAVDSMCAHHVGALVVCVDDVPVGIVTERDVMTRVVLKRLDPEGTSVEEAMTKDLVSVKPGTDLRQAMATMTERRCRHLPVVREDHIVGMISMGDLVRAVSREQSYEIRVLTNYITGAYPG